MCISSRVWWAAQPPIGRDVREAGHDQQATFDKRSVRRRQHWPGQREATCNARIGNARLWPCALRPNIAAPGGGTAFHQLVESDRDGQRRTACCWTEARASASEGDAAGLAAPDARLSRAPPVL